MSNKENVLIWLTENEELNNRLINIQLNDKHTNNKITANEIVDIIDTLGYEQPKSKYTADDIFGAIN